jgi:hypothetical protein
MVTNNEDVSNDQDEAVAMNMPDGFTPLNVSGQQNWVDKGPGVVVRGILKGRFKRNKIGKNKKETFFYQIKLTIDNVPAIFDKEEVSLDKGELVCVDETKALEGLEKLAEDTESVYEVFIKYIEKVPNQNDPGTSFWRTAVGYTKLDGIKIDW